MTTKQIELKQLITQAITEFNDKERFLIKNDLSERCICAKFATYIETELYHTRFNDYVVDVEYNRGYHGRDFNPKLLNGRKIVVDLVVHKRGYDETVGYDNLICIEMKKGYKHLDFTSDKERLRILTDDNYGYGYEIGFMIIVETHFGTPELVVNETFYNENR